MKLILIILLLFGTVLVSYANTGLAFLEIPVGARENALGGVGAALVTGPTSVVYNPAIMAFTPRSLALMHSRHFGDTRIQFAALTVRRGRFALTPHYWGTRVSDIEYREQPTRQPIGTFDATDACFGTAIAVRLNEHLALGTTVRYLHEKIFVESSDGWSLDAGILARKPLKGLTLGLALNHAGHMNTFVTESPRLPTSLRAGAAYERELSKYGTVLVAADAVGVKENTPVFRGGIEYRAPGYVALRAGWVEGLAAQDMSLGIGLFVKSFRFDYAFIPFRENLGEGHRFSLSMDI